MYIDIVWRHDIYTLYADSINIQKHCRQAFYRYYVSTLCTDVTYRCYIRGDYRHTSYIDIIRNTVWGHYKQASDIINTFIRIV